MLDFFYFFTLEQFCIENNFVQSKKIYTGIEKQKGKNNAYNLMFPSESVTQRTRI